MILGKQHKWHVCGASRYYGNSVCILWWLFLSFSQQIYTLPPPADPWVVAMQTAAPHNVESDTMHQSDEYRAVDVHLSFVNSSSPSFCQSTTNQELMVSTYIISTNEKIAFKKQTPPFALTCKLYSYYIVMHECAIDNHQFACQLSHQM